MMLSEHFSIDELTQSQTALRRGINNMPGELEVAYLKRLCEQLLEPARALLGVPLHVDSGYRCPLLNTAIGGASGSAHMYGRAADVIPIGMDLAAAFLKLKASDLPIDQMIIECGAWLHLAIAQDGSAPRRSFLAARGGPGHWTYVNA